MKSDRGVALILALLFLSFLTILASALLATTTIDVWISDNYNIGTKDLYLAEAGIDHARAFIGSSGSSPTNLLISAAGPDGILSTSTDLTSLLASDDRPLIPSDSSLRTVGQTLTDGSGRAIGHYHVWLRNDSGDGVTSATDTNQVLKLLSFATIGKSRKIIDVLIQKAGFPKPPVALTLDGPVGVFESAQSAFFKIEGITNTDAELNPILKSVDGLERLVSRITPNAADVYNPPFGSAQIIANYGTAAEYKVAVVNGDATLDAGSGYGMLVVRGNLRVTGNFMWNGLILVIGQGVIHWNASGNGSVNGGVFLARTRADDRTGINPIGTLLNTRGDITASFDGAGGTGIHYDASSISAANQRFPYTPISIRER